MPPEDVAALLRRAKLRVTGPRVAVIELLEQHPQVPADTVLRELRARSLAVTHQAVYDVLSSLTTAGLVRRVEPAGGPARYERRTGDHFRVVCRRCGQVEDVAGTAGTAGTAGDYGAAARPTALGDVDPASERVEGTWWGVCPRCAAPSVR